jgi:hypothetical protein
MAKDDSTPEDTKKILKSIKVVESAELKAIDTVKKAEVSADKEVHDKKMELSDKEKSQKAKDAESYADIKIRYAEELSKLKNIQKGDEEAAAEAASKRIGEIETKIAKKKAVQDEKDRLKNSKALLDDQKISIEHALKKSKLEKELAEIERDSHKRNLAFEQVKEKFNALTTDPVAFAKKLAQEKLIALFSKKARIKAQLSDLKHIEDKADKEKSLASDADKKGQAYLKLQKSISEARGTLGREQPIMSTPVVIASPDKNDSNITEGLTNIKEVISDGNVIADNALKQDAQQHKDDSETSAIESIGNKDSAVPQSSTMAIAGPPKPEGKGFGMPDPKKGLKGIIGNIMGKFGKAGKFLMNFGAKFLMPLITTPVGWAVLAGLAVGGLVFAYWDDIVAFVGKMFTGIKSMFSKVVSKISGMFSAVGNAIKEVISFFNPMNLLPMIARALLPTDMYDAVSSFFGGDTTEERDTRGKRDEAGVRAKQAESDAIEADDDLGEAMEVQKSSSADLNRLNRATAVGIHPNGNISIVEDMVNFQHNVPGAVRSILKSGARVATPEEVAALKASKEKNLAAADMKVKDLTIKSHAADRESYFASVEHQELDDLVKGSDQKKKKPGNVVADLVRSGAVDYSMFGNSTIKDWGSLRKLDYDTLEKVLAFDDWNDRTKRGILGIMDEKKQLMGANDLAPVAPNEISIKKKDDMVQQAVATGMRNKVGSSATTALPTSNNTVVAPTNVNNTTIKPPPASDTDVTNLAMQKGSAYAPSF